MRCNPFHFVHQSYQLNHGILLFKVLSVELVEGYASCEQQHAGEL